MADAQDLLVEHIQLGKPVTFITIEGAVISESELFSPAHPESPLYICFGSSHCFPVESTFGRIRCSRSGEACSLFSLYFLYVRRDASYKEYLQECRTRKVSPVSLVDKKQVIAVLDGSARTGYVADGKNECFTAEYVMRTVFGGEAQQMEEGAPQVGPARYERPLYSRNQRFLSRRDYSSAIPLLRSLLKTADQPAAPGSPVRQAQPETHIIIVPSSSSSIINLSNAKEFLENGRYVAAGEGGSRCRDSVVVKRQLRGDGVAARTISYQVVDSGLGLKDDEWKRVVAVFVQGAAWQFKGWKYSAPVDLFSTVMGFYLRFDDAPVDPVVKTWNVKVLSISRTKRHLDAKALQAVWQSIRVGTA